MKCPKCEFDNPDTVKFCSECGTQITAVEEAKPPLTKTIETPVEELTRGTIFAGRYEIIEELGRGGMGKVYRVEDKKIKQEVALKLIKPEIASDKKTLDRFSNELKTARMVAHKNVCRMFDLGEDKGTHYITMEYVSGEDLKSMLRMMGRMSPGQAISISKQVCEGLSEAHRLGVIHRDLKPSNIMIDKEGNARIMDFGIARSLKAKGITGSGIMIGTPEYMSPEQAEAKEVDHRSDIYSLGVILYEMVTGQLPFEGDTPLSIAMKHKAEPPDDPKMLNPQISDDLSQLILECMAKAKEDRYQSADQVLSALGNIEKGIPTTQKEIPKKKPMTSKEITVTLPTKKIYIPALVVIVIAIVALLLWRPWSKKAPAPLLSDTKSLAVVYFENNTGDENLDHWRKGISDLLITDLTQSKYLKVLGGDRLFHILNQMNQLKVKSYSSEVLREVAERGGVGHIVRGSYSKAGDIFRIDVVLQDAESGEPIATERIEGKGEEGIFSMVDSLTKWIKSSFDFSREMIAGDLDSAVATATTSSPEAFRHYNEAFRYNWMGDYRRSIQLLEHAVSLDPEFASAYEMLGTVWGNFGYGTKGIEYHKKALDLSDRLPDRERYSIQGYAYYNIEQKTWDKAIDAWNKYLRLYPDDLYGSRSLGYIMRGLERWDEAIRLFHVNIDNKTNILLPYTNVSIAYRAKGMYNEAKKILENYIKDFADLAGARYQLLYIYICQGQYELALREIDNSFLLNPGNYWNTVARGHVHLLRGDLIEAEEEYLKLFDFHEQVAHLRGRMGLAHLYLLLGKFDESTNQAKQGIDLAEDLNELRWKFSFLRYLCKLYLATANYEKSLDECNNAMKNATLRGAVRGEIRALHDKGLAYLQMKSFDEALTVAEKLKKTVDGWIYEKMKRYYDHHMGMIKLENKEYSDAIEHFQRAIATLPYQYSIDDRHAFFIAPMALTFYRKGDLEKAQEEYTKIINLTTGRLSDGDIYVKSFYMLGKIHEEMGNTAKAIGHYEKFLDLWKDADPGIVEVEDARERLAKLGDYD